MRFKHEEWRQHEKKTSYQRTTGNHGFPDKMFLQQIVQHPPKYGQTWSDTTNYHYFALGLSDRQGTVAVLPLAGLFDNLWSVFGLRQLRLALVRGRSPIVTVVTFGQHFILLDICFACDYVSIFQENSGRWRTDGNSICGSCTKHL